MSDPGSTPAVPATLQELAQRLEEGGAQEGIVSFEGDDLRRWSYLDLGREAARRAQALAGAGVRKGDAVLLCGPARPHWIAAFLALMRCGACAVPADNQFSAETFGHVLKDSGARLVLAAPSAAERFGKVCEDAGIPILPLENDSTEEASDRGDLAGLETVQPDECGVLFYTSGTTGPPKGVPLTHRNLAFQIEVLAKSGLIRQDDRILLPLPLHHVYPLVIGVVAPLALRVPVVMPDGFTGAQLLRALRDGNVTLMIGVPRLYEALIKGIEDRFARRGRIAHRLYRGVIAALGQLRRRLGWRTGRLVLAPLHRQLAPKLTTVASGGSALKPDTAWTLEALGWRVGSGYGLTETSPLLTINPPGNGRFETAGRPVDGVEIRIERPGPKPEEPGEVVARGPGVFAGYRNLPEKTTEAFTGDGWYRTGDLGFMDADGYLHLVGRKSTMMVTEGGENVQPDQIEELYERHPSIAEIAVFQSDEGIVGLIVPDPALRRRGDPAETVRTAVQEISRGLPSYQRLAAYRLTVEAIPRTRLGKPRRHLIAERYRKAGTDEEDDATSAETMPLDEMSSDDRALLENEAARDVFGLLGARFTGRRVTPDSDLQLDLGIDSIDWLDLSLEISERTGVALSEGTIAEISTVRDLLEQVAAGESDGVSVEAALKDPDSALDEDRRRWLEPPGRLSRWWFGLGARVNAAILRRFFQLRVSGLDNLPKTGNYVIAPNHLSYLDPFALAAALGRERLDSCWWAGWSGVLFTNPVRRAFARAAQVLPIDPMSAATSSLALGGAVLKRRRILVWFPEGARSPDGRLQEFRPGIGRVLEHWPTPVVPVVIRGSFEAWPLSRRLPRRHPVSVEFLPPIDPDSAAEQGEGETAPARIVAALHRRIAAALEQETTARKSRTGREQARGKERSSE